jgi:hypothetical protein
MQRVFRYDNQVYKALNAYFGEPVVEVDEMSPGQLYFENSLRGLGLSASRFSIKKALLELTVPTPWPAVTVSLKGDLTFASGETFLSASDGDPAVDPTLVEPAGTAAGTGGGAAEILLETPADPAAAAAHTYGSGAPAATERSRMRNRRGGLRCGGTASVTVTLARIGSVTLTGAVSFTTKDFSGVVAALEASAIALIQENISLLPSNMRGAVSGPVRTREVAQMASVLDRLRPSGDPRSLFESDNDSWRCGALDLAISTLDRAWAILRRGGDNALQDSIKVAHDMGSVIAAVCEKYADERSQHFEDIEVAVLRQMGLTAGLEDDAEMHQSELRGHINARLKPAIDKVTLVFSPRSPLSNSGRADVLREAIVEMRDYLGGGAGCTLSPGMSRSAFTSSKLVAAEGQSIEEAGHEQLVDRLIAKTAAASLDIVASVKVGASIDVRAGRLGNVGVTVTGGMGYAVSIHPYAQTREEIIGLGKRSYSLSVVGKFAVREASLTVALHAGNYLFLSPQNNAYTAEVTLELPGAVLPSAVIGAVRAEFFSSFVRASRDAMVGVASSCRRARTWGERRTIRRTGITPPEDAQPTRRCEAFGPAIQRAGRSLVSSFETNGLRETLQTAFEGAASQHGKVENVLVTLLVVIPYSLDDVTVKVRLGSTVASPGWKLLDGSLSTITGGALDLKASVSNMFLWNVEWNLAQLRNNGETGEEDKEEEILF